MNMRHDITATVPGGWADIERIAVFRALNLGDMLCFVPALRSLRRAFPYARISLVGLHNAGPLVARFHRYVDELVVFPGLSHFPEQQAQEGELPEFYRRMRLRRFDLALQMHGDGSHSNGVVERLGARNEAGFVPRGSDQRSGRWMLWPDRLHEIHRYLALLEYLGIDAGDDGLEFPLDADDQRTAEALLTRKGLEPSRTIVLHPGARLASRRWPLGRFAEVGKVLAGEGWQIAVTGSPAEASLTRTLANAIGRSVDLCGETDLGQLAAILRRCRLLVCNDTGISHVAAAMGTASVVIASGSDVNRWAPLDSTAHSVLHAPVACRPCAFDECPVGHICALGVEPKMVLEQARNQLRRTEKVFLT